MEPILSANSLIHFTRKLENLESILRGSFFPRVSLEENFFLKDGANAGWAIPMVCFCDIPLSQTRNHTKKYGKYAVGLTKEWGKSKGISPVLYTHPSSSLTRNLQDLFSEVEKELENVNGWNLPGIWFSYAYSAFFIKPYEGEVLINGKKQNVRFYDEREWRYIPSKEFLQKYMNTVKWGPFLSLDEFKNKTLVNDYNTELENLCGLSFNPKDIRYIVVSNENEILQLMDSILENKNDLISTDELKLLTTRIITLDQILEDF